MLSPYQSSKQAKPRVIAGIPAYNVAESIGDIIRRALSLVDEVIVADDGSTDNTAQVASAAGCFDGAPTAGYNGRKIRRAPIAQRTEHRSSEPRVVGSNPSRRASNLAPDGNIFKRVFVATFLCIVTATPSPKAWFVHIFTI
jgi:cellulose synthase/poly-beta-1,6-N-acetylglucosamine synthase-like glycosyltransferase